MKKYVRISRFAHFKRLRDRPTDRPTNRPTNRPTDMTSYRSARTHLKMRKFSHKYDIDQLFRVRWTSTNLFLSNSCYMFQRKTNSSPVSCSPCKDDSNDVLHYILTTSLPLQKLRKKKKSSEPLLIRS